MDIKKTNLANVLAQITPIDTGQRDPLLQLPIEFLHPSQAQPRQHFQPELLQELANSISVQGIIQPIVVRKIAADHFEIIAGERRWRAAQLAGLQEVPAIVKALDDKTAAALALIENIQREDLNPLEEANALKKLLENFAMTHQQVADALGKSRTAVTNSLRLLDLTDTVKPMLITGQLSMGHARALLSLTPALQISLAQKIIKHGLTVRATESLAQQAQVKLRTQQSHLLDTDTLRLQQRLTEILKAKVEIKQQKNGAGQLVIAYNSLQELDGILQYFKADDNFC
jgi:ParB family chromosome partitioning protein